ncbi:MAG: DUF1326 domain-containing protein [Candidatus Omnitrophica bacterium]|nr:DUF1326 domain-containing protein [Candidatus Omnitrophota bacterium]
MPITKKIKWSIEADFLQGCNCNYGCPCEFEAPPTLGYCEGLGVWKIRKGRYGQMSLNGLGFAFCAKWPAAIHQGNGTAALFFDERATTPQREALWQIASGQAGGLPFEIIATTFSKVFDPVYVPFKFHNKGRNSSARVGDALAVALEPIKNPVTGDAESIKIKHGTGFIFKEAECVSAKECRSAFKKIRFSWPGKGGFISKIKYSN